MAPTALKLYCVKACTSQLVAAQSVEIHKDLLYQRRWLTLLLWYNLVPGFFGAVQELIVLFSIPVFFLVRT